MMRTILSITTVMALLAAVLYARAADDPVQAQIIALERGALDRWGKGDHYKPRLEGQFIDITTVPSGSYVLIHRVNQDRRIRESSYENHASSVLLRIRRRAGRPPAVSVLRKCPDSDRCPAAT